MAEARSSGRRVLPGDAPGGRIPDGDADEATEEVARAFDTARAAAAAAAKKEAAKAAAGSAAGMGPRRGPRRGPDEESPARMKTTRRGARRRRRRASPRGAESDDVLTGAAAASSGGRDRLERAARTFVCATAALVRNCPSSRRGSTRPARFAPHKSFVEGELKAAEIKQLMYNRWPMSLKKFEDGEPARALAVRRRRISSRRRTRRRAWRTRRSWGVNERKQKVLNEFDKFVVEEHAGVSAYEDFPRA